MQNVKATRADLIKTKEQIKLAKTGYKLLKKKRDGLIMEFFQLLKRSKTIRTELDDAYAKAQHRINIARVLEGDLRVSSTALAIRENPSVEVSTKNVIGVQVPRITSKTTKQEHEFFNSAAITEAAESYELLMDKIILAAELETSIRKLLLEIEKTKRRVNALEFEVIPKMEKIKQVIVLRLDEIDRDSFFRLKLSKQKISQTA